MAIHPIFGDIKRGDLEAVKQRVLADLAVLEETHGLRHSTPLIYAAHYRKPAIAHWLIDHRGQHDVDAQDDHQMTALHWACFTGPLSVVQALMASGADPAVTELDLTTPLMYASSYGHSDIVAYLLQMQAVRATVDTVNQYGRTALFFASSAGHASCVQLLLDAGADPTIHAGDWSLLNCAIRRRHDDIAALLRHAIAEPDRAHALHKARSLLDAAHVIRKTKHDARDDGDSPTVQQHKAIAAAPIYLKGRVQRDEALPRVELTAHQGDDDERVRATVAFVVGREEGGVEYAGLPRELYKELLGYLMHAWADKGPEEEDEGEEDEDDSERSDEDDSRSGSEGESEEEGSDTD